MELTAIPGVGEKTANALSTLEDPEAALEDGDVAALSSAPGISTSRAARIARAAIRASHGDEGGFLATDRARVVYEDLLALLKERAVTEYGTHRLETLYPTAIESRIEEVRALSTRALERDPDPTVIDALGGVEPLDQPPTQAVRDRCLATRDAERFARAKECFPELSVELVDDARGLAELARGYSTVIALDEAFAGVDIEGEIRIEPDALERPFEIVPERTLTFFAHNRETIEAAIEASRRADIDVKGDISGLQSALERVGPDGTPRDDPELDRLRTAVADLDAALQTAEHVAEDRLRDAIRNRDVTIEGTDLLSLVEQGASVDSLLDHELATEYEEAVSAARAHLIDALALTEGEADLAREVFPDRTAYPIARDDEATDHLRSTLRADRDIRATAAKRDLAMSLEKHRELARTLVGAALELDVELAISRFATDYDCMLPSFGGAGIAIDDGRSPLLAEPVSAIDPVSYDVDDVVLLSGVNSGGKTALLDLLAATVILAHMGLPVPARCARIERFESLHYYAATQGTLDAGAFEATLRQFADLIAGPSGRLVLVDELESITEPGAAANIVAGILEELRGNATAIFVSHLAAEIRDVAAFDVRVDGIEAEGVRDGSLVVNRSPVTEYLARSTPELLVEQLATEADEVDAVFYDRLLEKFD